MNLESHEVNEDRQYADYKEQVNPSPSFDNGELPVCFTNLPKWTYRKYQYTGMPVEWIVQKDGSYWISVPHEERAKDICSKFNLQEDFEKIIKGAYEAGEVDGYNERASGKKDREYKSAQDYYERGFKL